MSSLLSIYLNDHLAGATAGVELARRARSSNRGSAEFGPALERLCAEIESDRDTLERLMGALGVERSAVKPAAAWLGEKLGRLKPNGQLHGYSPLSRVIELEGICMGIAGKRALWSSLAGSLGPSWKGFDFERQGQRAADQLERAQELHRLAAERALQAPAAAA